MERFTIFLCGRRIAGGSRAEVIAALRTLPAPAAASDLLVFDDRTGRQIDLDLTEAPPQEAAKPATRGRPALGVVAREVTLLPRHWAWLGDQPGGASPVLRRLVERAMAGDDGGRAGFDAAYRFLTAIAGDQPHYEAAIRALYAKDRAGFEQHMAGWPADVRSHALGLAWPA